MATVPRLFVRPCRRPETGAAAVEFALILPIFVLVVYGLVTFGDLFYTQMVVSRAAADGARALAVLPGATSFDALSEPDKDAVREQVINSLAASIVAQPGSDYAARKDWLEDNVRSGIAVDQGSCGVADAASGFVRVQVAFPYERVRILPPVTLPLVGSTDSWMADTLVGCAVTRL